MLKQNHRNKLYIKGNAFREKKGILLSKAAKYQCKKSGDAMKDPDYINC